MQSAKKLSQCYKKTQSCCAVLRALLTWKKGLTRLPEAEHLRLLKLLQPSAFHINPGLYDTTHDIVNASAQS